MTETIEIDGFSVNKNLWGETPMMFMKIELKLHQLLWYLTIGPPKLPRDSEGEGLPEVGDGAGAAHLAERAVVHATADDLLANLRSRIVAEKRGTTRAGWTHPGCGRRG